MCPQRQSGTRIAGCRCAAWTRFYFTEGFILTLDGCRSVSTPLGARLSMLGFHTSGKSRRMIWKRNSIRPTRSCFHTRERKRRRQTDQCAKHLKVLTNTECSFLVAGSEGYTPMSNPGDVLTCCASHTILRYALSELSPRILLTPDDGPHRSVDHPDKNSCTSKVVCCSLADHAEPQTSALSGHSGAFDRFVWSKATVELLFLLSE